MRLTVFRLMIITLICSVLWGHPAVNVSTVANVDSTEQHFSQISQSIHQPQFEHNDVHHTAENKDDCCDVDCCESNCICIANACAPYSCLASEVHSANALFIIDSVYMPYSESPLFISNSLYRPPITIV